jgi:hypothetical protein
VLSPDEADVALYQDEPHMRGQEYQIWEALGTAAPVAVDGLDGVPMVLVYRRASSAEKSPSAIEPSPSGVASPASKPPE